MRAYDVHQHLWPEPLIVALETRHERPRLRGRRLELSTGDWEIDLGAHALDARLALLDRDELDVAVISCPPTLELDDDLRERYHEGILELVAASSGRLLAFSCGRARDGFVGACVAASELADLAELTPLLSELEQRGEVLFVHPGPVEPPYGAPDWWSAVVGYTAQMQAAYASWLALGTSAWPNLNVVFAILAGGAPIQLERLASRGFDSRSVLEANIYLDTASYGDRALELSLATYGVGRLVYGSDTPVIESGATLRSVRGFGQAVADAVCRDNPGRLFG